MATILSIPSEQSHPPGFHGRGAGQIRSNRWRHQRFTSFHPAKQRGGTLPGALRSTRSSVQLTGDGRLPAPRSRRTTAKYAASQPGRRCPARRITANAASSPHADQTSHEGRLIAACLRLGATARGLPGAAPERMPSYRGHFATKSAVAPPQCALVRREPVAPSAAPPSTRATAVITITDLQWAGQGGAPRRRPPRPLRRCRAREQRRITAKRWPSRRDRRRRLEPWRSCPDDLLDGAGTPPSWPGCWGRPSTLRRWRTARPGRAAFFVLLVTLYSARDVRLARGRQLIPDRPP
jgi:hypothetical protein